MTDQTSDRLTTLEQRQQQQDRTIAQINEILLVVARQQQVNAQQLAALDSRLDRNAAQVEANTLAIAELRAILRDRYGNGLTPE